MTDDTQNGQVPASSAEDQQNASETAQTPEESKEETEGSDESAK